MNNLCFHCFHVSKIFFLCLHVFFVFIERMLKIFTRVVYNFFILNQIMIIPTLNRGNIFILSIGTMGRLPTRINYR